MAVLGAVNQKMKASDIQTAPAPDLLVARNQGGAW
jgi:hypothetical protein